MKRTEPLSKYPEHVDEYKDYPHTCDRFHYDAFPAFCRERNGNMAEQQHQCDHRETILVITKIAKLEEVK